MKGKLKLALILGVLGLLTSLLAVLPAFGEQGEIVILDEAGGDAIVWSNPGATIFVQVTDSDLNVALATSDDPVDVSCNNGVPTPAFHELGAKGPVLDRNGDGFQNSTDVSVLDTAGNAITTVSVFSVDLSEFRLNLACKGSFPDTAVTFTYDAPGANTVGTEEDPFSVSLVKVTSEADEVGIGIQLSEIRQSSGSTAKDTGVFGIELVLCETAGCSATTSPPRIEVATEVNDLLTISYDDASDGKDTITVSIENVEPDFAGFAPAHEFATTTGRPTLSGDVSDVDSGVLEDPDGTETIEFIIQAITVPGSDGSFRVRQGPETLQAADTGTVDQEGDVFAVSHRVPSTLVSTDDVYILQWWIIAEDIAGNKGVSDEDSNETACLPGSFDKTDISTVAEQFGCEPWTIRIDFTSPSIASAVTGNSWDSEDEVVLSGTDAIRTSIEVIFDDALDGETVDAGDFNSTDVDIRAVDWFSDKPESVFLTVDAMDSDDEPDIDLVGEVRDQAGNGEDEDTVEADDGIPAALTVTVTGTAASRPVTDDEITISVQADEALTGNPVVHVRRIGTDFKTTGNDLGLGEVNLSGTLMWEATFDVSNPGLYNVYVLGTDLGARIENTAGVLGVDLVIDIDDDDVILFEVDTGIPDPDATPEGSTDDTSPFIILDFTDEGLEYGLTTGDVRTVDPATVDEDFDEHATITITAATLDDVAITFETNDDIVFLYKATDLALGEHDVIVTYEDEAGNEVEDFTFAFDVEARVDFKAPLAPGWNLISLPGDPINQQIDAVIGTDIAVTAVYGYDPGLAGQWLVAVRERQADGTFGPFAGPLTEITAEHGYWVLTTTFQPVSVQIPALAAGAVAGGLPPLPPTINIVIGWNLVPIRDVTGDAVAGDTRDADEYFAGLEISRVYSYNTVDDAWVLVDPTVGSGDTVEIGNAYWVFATEAGTLVP